VQSWELGLLKYIKIYLNSKVAVVVASRCRLRLSSGVCGPKKNSKSQRSKRLSMHLIAPVTVVRQSNEECAVIRLAVELQQRVFSSLPLSFLPS